MPPKISPMISILVLLVSLSLLLPPTSTRNTHFGKKCSKEIQRNLIDVGPGGHTHAGSGMPKRPPRPFAADSEKKKFYFGNKGP